MEHWKYCLSRLESELSPQQFNTWIRPLQSPEEQPPGKLQLYAPNAFVLDWVRKHYLSTIESCLLEYDRENPPDVVLEIGSLKGDKPRDTAAVKSAPGNLKHRSAIENNDSEDLLININRGFTFDNYVEGKSNQLARAAGMQIGEAPGKAYNPLFIYGGTGLGKTHLLHAIGNLIAEHKPHYSQEEFFHTFNALFESQQQIILTSDRFPREVDGLEDRLKSRFGWGLTVAIEPPDLETRVAILMNKAQKLFGVELPSEVAFFIGQRVRSNIRELEGALRRVVANAQFTGRPITLDFAKDALRDMIAAQDKQITIENIQKVVAEYYKIRSSDMLSRNRSRTVARPRQIAMALAKELTNHSLPEIGKAFGGKDHTTVLYATRKIQELKDSDSRIEEDYKNLLRTLSH